MQRRYYANRIIQQAKPTKIDEIEIPASLAGLLFNSHLAHQALKKKK